MNQIVAFFPGIGSDEELGIAVLEALESYQVLALEQVGGFFELGRVQARFAEWERDVCSRAGYGSKQKLYKALKLASVTLTGAQLSVFGTARRRGAAFEGNGFSLTTDVGLGAVGVGNAVKIALEERA